MQTENGNMDSKILYLIYEKLKENNVDLDKIFQKDPKSKEIVFRWVYKMTESDLKQRKFLP